MTQRTSFTTTWLPLMLAAVALLVLNAGLYLRLSSQPAVEMLSLPYTEDFATLDAVPYQEFGGDWSIRDERLVQVSTSGFDLSAFVPLDIAPDQPYTFAATLQFLGGSPGGGLIFNAQQDTSRQQSHMLRFNVDAGDLYLIWGVFGDDSNFQGQGSSLLDLPPDTDTPQRLAVRVRSDAYDILWNERVLVPNIPLLYQGGTVGFLTAASQVAFDDVVVAPLDETTTVEAPVEPTTSPDTVAPTETAFVAGTQLATDNFEAVGDGESLWSPLSGIWSFRDGRYVQETTTDFDRITVYQRPLQRPYRVEVTMQHLEGLGGGLVFALPNPTERNGGAMVRYFEENVIAWGTFSDDGVFAGLDSSPVLSPGDSAQRLSVEVGAASFNVLLNGDALATNIPLGGEASDTHYVGLTASQSAVAFDDFAIWNVNRITDRPAPDIRVASATGIWENDGAVIRQLDETPTDFVAGTGFRGEQYIVTLDITLPPDRETVGAGLVFHMSARDAVSGGHMARLADGGERIFWGRYDEAGVFSGSGNAALTPDDADRIELQLRILEGSYSLVVNGNTVVEDIPLERDEGWIGLLSFGGPVEFRNFRIEPGG